MVEGEELLFRPVMRGMFHADRLVDCSIDLAFVMLCNEAIDVENENNRRADRFAKAAAPKGAR